MSTGQACPVKKERKKERKKVEELMSSKRKKTCVKKNNRDKCTWAFLSKNYTQFLP